MCIIMCNNVCYILRIYSKLMTKVLNFNHNKPHYTCGYVSCTSVEDFTVWCMLIHTRPTIGEPMTNLYPPVRQLTKASEPSFDLVGGVQGQKIPSP